MKFFKLIFLLIGIFFNNDLWGKPNFKENLIWPSIYKNRKIGLTYPFGLRLSDINDDKNLDIVHCDITRQNKRELLISECYIHYGLGNGTFSTIKIFKRLGLLERLFSINIDNDKFQEIFIVNNLYGGFELLLNEDVAEFSLPESWNAIKINTLKMPRTYDIVAGNVNGDNCPDIVISGYSGAGVLILENPCDINSNNNYRFSDWIPNYIGHNLPNKKERMTRVKTVNLFDFDNDGDLDILANSEGISHSEDPPQIYSLPYVRIFVNPGKISEDWKVIDLEDSLRGSNHSTTCDIDNDGDKDIIVLFGSGRALNDLSKHGIYLYENISKIKRENISRNIDFKRIFIKNEPYAFEVECSELEGNNSYKEIIYSTHNRSSMNKYKFDKISILKKTESNSLKNWEEEILKEDSTNPNDIEIGDIDNDGDLDIVVISDNGNNKNKSTNGSNIIWFENQIQN